MRKITTIIAIIAMIALFASCFTGCNGSDTKTNTTPSITEPIPTNTSIPTSEETVIPDPIITVTPEIEPTKIPDTPTPIPLPTAIPTPEPTATPEPTSTPVPATPTPVIKVDENAKLLDSVKMGDNVWYDIYDDGTLVVRGKGKTKDLILPIEHTVEAIDIKLVDTVIIEEGITELGEYSLGTLYYATKVVFPKSLKKIGGLALYAIGDMAEEIEYIDLDTDKVEIDATSFLGCGNPEKIKDAEKYTAMPTPTPIPPTPTPTPKPDPNNPRKVRSVQMGDNVYFEFWDNGYLYVRGSGPIWNQQLGFGWYDIRAYYDENKVVQPYVTRKSYVDEHHFPKDFCESITHIVIDDEVTQIGRYAFMELDNVVFIKLPKSLDASTLISGKGEYQEVLITGDFGKIEIAGYWEGRMFTLRDEYLDYVLLSMWYTTQEKKPENGTFLEKYGEKLIWWP